MIIKTLIGRLWANSWVVQFDLPCHVVHIEPVSDNVTSLNRNMSKSNNKTFAPYKNGFEAAVAAQNPTYEYEPKDIKLAYVIKHVYKPDFVDRDNKIIRESKGHFPASDRAKMKAVKAAHPDWTIIMIFQNPDKTISKKSSTSYAKWCDDQGILWEKGPVSLKKQKTSQKPSKGVDSPINDS